MLRSCGVGLEDAHRGHLPAPAAGKKQAPAADPGRRRTGGAAGGVASARAGAEGDRDEGNEKKREIGGAYSWQHK